jgi:Prenyltransferase and squalene oxidase repeat
VSTVLALVAFALGTAGSASAAALAAADSTGAAAPEHQKSIDRIVAFLEGHELESGAYADTGGSPSPSISAWVTMAVAAAGVNPLDQTRFAAGAPCGDSAQEYLEAHFLATLGGEAGGAAPTTAFERELLVVDTSGTDPHDFAGVDLVGQILARQNPDGGLPYVPGGESQVNDAVFGILALAPIAEPAAEAAVVRAAAWLLTAQDADGGFNWRGPGEASEVDLTGAAIEALSAAGMHGTEAEARALGYLRGAQLPDGGFPEYPGTEAESNVASTAWGVQGIWASGGDPETWTVGAATPPAEPLDYLESMQAEDGHLRWEASRDLNGIWMTAYALPAFTGQTKPYPYVPRSSQGAPRLASCEVAADPVAPGGAAESAGAGTTPPPSGAPPLEGAAPQPAAGVAAGGGGEGAPDFSRPKPGSKGRTPGGARVVRHGRGEEATDRSRTRRGTNRHQPAGTETAEPRAAAEPEGEVDAVSGASPATAAKRGGATGEGGAGRRSHHPGAVGTPIPTKGARRSSPTTTGEEVSGVVIGSPAGGGGNLAFGAPGLRSAGAGSGDGKGPAIAIAIAALLAALGGAGWERKRGERTRGPLG